MAGDFLKEYPFELIAVSAPTAGQYPVVWRARDLSMEPCLAWVPLGTLLLLLDLVPYIKGCQANFKTAGYPFPKEVTSITGKARSKYDDLKPTDGTTTIPEILEQELFHNVHTGKFSEVLDVVQRHLHLDPTRSHNWESMAGDLMGAMFFKYALAARRSRLSDLKWPEFFQLQATKSDHDTGQLTSYN